MIRTQVTKGTSHACNIGYVGDKYQLAIFFDFSVFLQSTHFRTNLIDGAYGPMVELGLYSEKW